MCERTGNRLQQALVVLLCPVVVLFHVLQCTVLTKAKLGKACVWVPGKPQISV